MNRRLLLVVVLIIIIAVGAVAFLALGGLPTTPTPNGTPGDDATQPVVQRDDATLPPTNTLIPFTEVVIAVQDIPRGVTIEPNMVALISFPAQSVAFGAFNNTEDVIGKIARTDIVREEHILTSKVVDDLTGLGRVGSDAAAILPPNLVAVSLPIDQQTSVSYALQPGDRVDVIVSMLFVDVDPDFQTVTPNAFRPLGLAVDEQGGIVPTFQEFANGRFESIPIVPPVVSINPESGNLSFEQTQLPFSFLINPSENQRPRLVTQRTVLDALVVWLGEFPEDGRIFRPAATPTPIVTDAAPVATLEPTAVSFDDTANGGTGSGAEAEPANLRPDSVTLAVQPQDAVILTYLAEAGLPLTFALRSAGSTTLQPTEPVTLGFILNRFNISVPERFTFAVEPAIRSIRELSLGDRIELRPEVTPEPASDDN